MPSTRTNQKQTIRISVDASSETGIKIGQFWYNLTKKQQNENWALPSAKDTINLTFHEWETPDGKTLRFIDEWDYAEAGPQNTTRGHDIDPEAALGPAQASQWLRDDKPIVTRLACQRDAISLVTAWLNQPGMNYQGDDGEVYKPLSLQDLEEKVMGLAIRLETAATWGGGGTTSDEER